MLQAHYHPVLEQLDDNQAQFRCGQREWTLQFTVAGDYLQLQKVEGGTPPFVELHQMLDQLWGRLSPQTLGLSTALAETLPLNPHCWTRVKQNLEISRAGFYQQREPWLAPALWPIVPQEYVDADCPGGRHPKRPRLEDGLLYQKCIVALGEVFELRRVEVARDGELFHRWQNDPRVAAFWEENHSREALDEYLEVRRRDPHCEPLFAYFDGLPFAYIELYWAREDRIGPYYEVDDYDLGLHMLVGERRFLGRKRTTAWLRAMSHFMFLLDPRTQRLVGEPRVDNKRILALISDPGWRVVKEFDFPHKRAALTMCEREAFFRDIAL